MRPIRYRHTLYLVLLPNIEKLKNIDPPVWMVPKGQMTNLNRPGNDIPLFTLLDAARLLDLLLKFLWTVWLNRKLSDRVPARQTDRPSITLEHIRQIEPFTIFLTRGGFVRSRRKWVGVPTKNGTGSPPHPQGRSLWGSFHVVPNSAWRHVLLIPLPDRGSRNRKSPLDRLGGPDRGIGRAAWEAREGG